MKALIDGEVSPTHYDVAATEKENYDPEIFQYLGTGHIVSHTWIVWKEQKHHFWRTIRKDGFNYYL